MEDRQVYLLIQRNSIDKKFIIDKIYTDKIAGLEDLSKRDFALLVKVDVVGIIGD